VTKDSPAHAGDTLILYCSGLGLVDPPVVSGSTPGSLSTTTNEVQLTMGDRPAKISFAGVAPGLVGLYQVNAIVPGAIPAGSAVPITITVAGQTSPQITIPIQN